ncbi:EscU/YscU/HrcU family type III secretion system export apparatus switch protein [Arthrobacter agilis]|uniref:EscU/YscU/HrcU family type III secretion system export apparatus switch protein n=1 Tax=Arthrobacter agilis TaxID=37921 RepID=UPI000B354B8B|nr:EscU/YscU/HrcU family type III secretion system export apparatus switch protein [Arthrobacter agilis]OUM43751.1 type III secretion protein [Arthrobacter agilis]PPB46663.1 flagellar type III secretion system protein FlhB [Arthrobacter agilis]TPV24993.1 EscU/YscU/HrcU family type III secretion system export apparatus switch protein [Arthrobacter agilis]VDR31171.1 Flagellar biosynthetic protein flhB [Arthrobacter agilis]
MADDSGEKTEQATDKRMKDVRSKGQLSKSEDFTAWIGVGAAALMLPSVISRAADAATEQLARVADTIASPDPDTALDALADGGTSLGVILGPFLGILLVAVLGTAAVQGGIHPKKFKGKFEQFNVVNGLKRILGGQALWQGAKALLKTAVVALVLIVVVRNLMPLLMAAGGLSVASLLNTAGDGTAALLQAAVVAGLALAAVDVLVVMRRNRKKTRMTKKEVKDENKSSEGDPLIKAQRRSRQLAMSRNRMIAAVSGSDVVLVNPTHVAVALKYEPGRSAPRVVAKGAGVIAARIREEAEKKHVPMVSDIPLARALHAACELGEEIPFENYDQVARILAFVMSLRTRGAARGLHTLPVRPAAAGGF